MCIYRRARWSTQRRITADISDSHCDKSESATFPTRKSEEKSFLCDRGLLIDSSSVMDAIHDGHSPHNRFRMREPFFLLDRRRPV